MPDAIKDGDTRERWYYDACTSDQSKSAYAEMYHPIYAIVSHLAFGEAYAGAYLKSPEAIEAFIGLMVALRPYVYVVQNDGSDSILNQVREAFPRLTITDALHVATAIENHCVVIRTLDSDLLGLPPVEVSSLGVAHGLPHLSITEVRFRR